LPTHKFLRHNSVTVKSTGLNQKSSIMKSISDMTTVELVAEYNTATGKSIKKFSSRAAGEKQVGALRDFAKANAGRRDPAADRRGSAKHDEVNDQFAAELLKTAAKGKVSEVVRPHGFEVHGQQVCPSCGIDLNNGVGEHKQEVNGKEVKHDDFEFSCLGCGAEFGPAIRKVASSPERSASIKASWEDPAVAAKRAERDHVEVDGVQYRSVAAAFKALGLPMGKHITFRIALKAEGEKEFKFGTDAVTFKVCSK
jgi:hypothetical protein